MRLNAALMVLALIVIASMAPGCISGGVSGPGASATASSTPPSQGTATPGPVIAQSLTDAQKNQAISVARGDARLKDIMNNPGYKVIGVMAGGKEYWTEDMGNNAVIAIVTIQGGETEHSDGSLWTPDQYSVVVDVNGGKVSKIMHIEPKPLPTPAP